MVSLHGQGDAIICSRRKRSPSGSLSIGNRPSNCSGRLPVGADLRLRVIASPRSTEEKDYGPHH
jgi:hypothetical protein